MDADGTLHWALPDKRKSYYDEEYLPKKLDLSLIHIFYSERAKEKILRMENSAAIKDKIRVMPEMFPKGQ